MIRRGIPALLALVLALAGTAQGATYCVGTTASGCESAASVKDAFDAARAHSGPDRILLGEVAEAGPFADAPNEPVQVDGAGPDKTVLRAPGSGDVPTLRLTEPSSAVGGLRVTAREVEGATALELAGRARNVVAEASGAATGAVRLLDGATLAGSRARAASGAAIRMDRGDARVQSTVAIVSSRAGAALQASCAQGDATLRAHHVTVVGAAGSAGRATCAQAGRTAALEAVNTVLSGAFAAGALRCEPGPGRARLTTGWSSYQPGPDGCASADRASMHDVAVDPGLTPDGRLAPGSRLIEAGEPAPLSRQEPAEDADGAVRAVDGDGDGTARRDIGAFEFQPPARALPAGNVLANPGAEAGTATGDDRASPAPSRWQRTGGFTSVRYGTFPFPSSRAGAALGGGSAFFAGGPGSALATASQTVDITSAAPEVDAGVGRATVSSLLGGFGETGDEAVVQAIFRDPAGVALGELRAGPVTAAERANATTLAFRSAGGRIPHLTRAIEVVLRATRTGGAYNDAYFDNVGLQLAIPGAPRRRGRRRAFAGLAVLAPSARIDARGRARVRLGCARSTVRRCRGIVTLTTAPRRRTAPPERIGAAPVRLRRGARRSVAIELLGTGRRLARRRRSAAVRLYTAVRDGQGATRTSVAPMRLRRRARR